MLCVSDFWQSTNKSSNGNIIISTAVLWARAVPTASTAEPLVMTFIYGEVTRLARVFALEKKADEKEISVHCQQKENKNTVAIIVLAFGSITLIKVRKTDAPSIYAALSKSFGRPMKNDLIR